MQDFEKLGVFYLGRLYDMKAGKAQPDLLLYDSKDLVTHGVCVGMTGSGKTGLCLSLLEEAAIDSIPAIMVDPKGDLGNLLLTFPGLTAAEFQPWVNEEDARKAGVSVADFAAREAETWKKGLADWGQDGDRIRRLRDAAEFAIYTPGRTRAGRCRCSNPSRLHRKPFARTRRHSANASAELFPASSGCWASRPIRSRVASTSSSPRFLVRPGPRARTLPSPI